jgi:hypothetical protein
MTELVLERKRQDGSSGVVVPGIMMTPDINEDYWMYRVKLSDKQAVLAFPKFGTIGCGFAVEEDWNTNLPIACQVDDIFAHIARNKGDDSIPDERVKQAIGMIRDAVREADPAWFAEREARVRDVGR